MNKITIADLYLHIIYPRNAATAPNLPGRPSIIAASHSTIPLLLGKPPRPTM